MRDAPAVDAGWRVTGICLRPARPSVRKEERTQRRSMSSAHQSQALAEAAAANVGRMAFVGVTEMPSQSQALLEATLGLPKGSVSNTRQ